ncbi:LysR family transcriptional regulator [Alteromonas australica]|uniref:LysR family transcriptional regulator n=1 Tax=Alteromonas australica TaxID=589873 RepID=UPI002357F5BD|nr:LysR family transcriptional regulator [Alteromonas australica]|tara:strand:+ start:2686 stop:3594 length:909 start_codon:yes stop_codon:yes gene_type:complete
MSKLNYRHLEYFYTIAKSGSITRASEILHITPQTLSAQLSKLEERLGYPLFERRGKRLELNDIGRLTYGYAKEIFALGDELLSSLDSQSKEVALHFSIGVTPTIDKAVSFNLLKEIYSTRSSVHLVCKETNLEELLPMLAVGKIDAIISEAPLPLDSSFRAFNHLLAESGLTFFAEKSTAQLLRDKFPLSLDQYPIFTSGDGANQRPNLLSWFDRINISPKIIGEFDDSALAKYFTQAGYGVFCASSSLENQILEQFNLAIVGRTYDISERIYLISPERKVKHPVVKQLLEVGYSLFKSPVN